ncbi:MAG: extracellular solute-binding protein [Lachnospiraceae bacterium]|nr:extracellular solute-binding protein [Lachnospiraceae bacterium]
MKKKILSMLLCAATAVTLLAGCGGGSDAGTDAPTGGTAGTEAEGGSDVTDEKVVLDIYAQYADDDTMVPYDYALEQLAVAYPNVELNLIVQAQDDGTTLKTMAATGQLPDIFQANTDIINTLRETNQVMVLNDVADKTGFSAKIFESCKGLAYAEDGNMYAFPYAGDEYVLWYYNKALFTEHNLEVPTTYDELLNCIEVFKANGIVPLALFGQEGWNTAAMFDAIATRYAAGGIKTLDTQEASITDEGYVKAANKLEELVKAGLFQTGATTTNYDQASEMFLSGKAAMFINGQWYIEDATKTLGENVDWMFYPAEDEAAYEAGKAILAGGGSTSGYAVNPDSEHAELAAEVAAFISEKYCEAKVLYRHNPLVALDTGKTSEDGLPAMMQKLSDTIPSLTGTTKFTWGLTNPIFNEGLCTETQGLVSGQFSAEEFLLNMEDVQNNMN